MKFSLFANSFAEKPQQTISIDDFAHKTKSGEWAKLIEKLRSKSDPAAYKKLKASLPGATISGEFKSRSKYLPLSQRLKSHTGLICLDIDRKDNAKMRVKDLIDKECLMQFVSCSGEGIKIIYRCSPTRDAAEHRRIYDAAVQRLEKKGVKLKIDPIVKSISSLQYVTYDPNLFYFPKSKLVIEPLPPIKIAKTKPSEDQKKDIEQLEVYISALDSKDATADYEDWLTICFGLSYSLGEAGRKPFHEISKNYKNYSKLECDEKYDSCLERDSSTIERPVTLASVYQILGAKIPKVQLRQLAKKYNKGHTVGVGEDIEQGDLSGFVRYKLFLFKKIFDKESNTLIELTPAKLNLNAFETLLREKGFYRYENMFVHIQDNIVEKVDGHDILRLITEHIENDGDYTFTYKKLEFTFSWEELVHLWRELRGQSSMMSQLSSSLTHWVPNLLTDSDHVSFIPYRNGVLQIEKSGRKLLPYSSIKSQIWKERILPREFKYTVETGMFEHFFQNVCGRGNKKVRSTERYNRSLWYFGYMLHGFKLKSLARAWMIYDIKAGNSGRTGKTIIGQAVGCIRNVTTIDGKQIDFRNRFALQKVTPWTEVVFIDDPYRGMSIGPLFNMITGESDAEKKGKDPITRSLKFMFASNWLMEIEETSEQGRQFVTQIDDFYVRYSKENGNCLRPLVHLHGKEFFTSWNEKDWSQFDSFAIRALEYYLSTPEPSNLINGNAYEVRFIQQHGEELYFELSSTFINHVKRSKEGGLVVGQRVLANVIKESTDFHPSTNKCGRMVREFIQAISGDKPGITSLMIGNLPQMAYKINKKYEEINFGELQSSLPKPKL